MSLSEAGAASAPSGAWRLRKCASGWYAAGPVVELVPTRGRCILAKEPAALVFFSPAGRGLCSMNDSPAISRAECFRRIEAMYATHVTGRIAGTEHEKALSWLKSCVDPGYAGWEACVAKEGRASRSRLLELLEDLGMDADTGLKILTEAMRLWRLTQIDGGSSPGG